MEGIKRIRRDNRVFKGLCIKERQCSDLVSGFLVEGARSSPCLRVVAVSRGRNERDREGKSVRKSVGKMESGCKRQYMFNNENVLLYSTTDVCIYVIRYQSF